MLMWERGVPTEHCSLKLPTGAVCLHDSRSVRTGEACERERMLLDAAV